MHDLILLMNFLFLATWPNKPPDINPLITRLSLKFLFLVLRLLQNLRKKKTVFFLTLGRNKKLMDYIRNG